MLLSLLADNCVLNGARSWWSITLHYNVERCSGSVGSIDMVFATLPRWRHCLYSPC